MPYGQAVPPEQLEKALAEHPDAVAVFATLSETSTGVGNDIAGVRQARRQDAGACSAVDAISGLGVMECRTDDWHIDLSVTGSQKALMLPPGLAFVSVSDKAWAKIETNTPAADVLLRPEEVPGEDRRERHAVHAGPHADPGAAVEPEADAGRGDRERLGAARPRRRRGRAGVQAMGLELFAERPADGLTVVKVPAGIDGTAVLGKLEKQYGLKLANGQDTLKGKIFRLAHMGYIDQFDVLAALAGLELVLLEMGYGVEPGTGVAAVQRVLAESSRVHASELSQDVSRVTQNA